jgi:rhamnosyltransferase
MNTIASIILYNPEIKRLQQNIEAILPQINEIIIIDNASSNFQEVERLINNYSKISIIKNKTNTGIAAALNQAAIFAMDKYYDWLLTLDQDTVCASNIIETYNQFTNIQNIGILTCNIQDRNFSITNTAKDGFVDLCITSGAFMNLNAWKKVFGFDETMFIDSVDFDFCISLRDAGYKIFKTTKTKILHEVGHSRIVNFLGKEELILNHSCQRYYYIIRNTIYLGRKHQGIPLLKQILLSIKKIILVLFFEKSKSQKIKLSIKGLIHGFFMKINKI